MSEPTDCTSCDCDAKDADTRAGQRLKYLTIGWNVAEAGIAVAAGLFAGSIALIGFGVDSVIESLSGVILLWRLRSPEHGDARERTALRLVGISFFILAAYLVCEAGAALLHREPPHASWVGIGLSIVSLIVMPLLARAKRPCGHTTRQPGS